MKIDALADQMPSGTEAEVTLFTPHVRVPDLVIVYLNRLSDLLFTLARLANKRAGAGEVTW